MNKLLVTTGILAATCSAYAVTETTSPSAAFALYTSAVETPTYAVAAGALSSPFLITYREGETVSVTSPNGVTTQLSGSDGTISYTPVSGGVWKFRNSNGASAYVGVGWNGDGFAPVTDDGSIAWIDTMQTGPDRKVKRTDNVVVSYSDAAFAGSGTGVVTLTLTSPSNVETVYTKQSGDDAQTLRLDESGEWTAVLTTSAGTSTAKIKVSGGLVIIIT